MVYKSRDSASLMRAPALLRCAFVGLGNAHTLRIHTTLQPRTCYAHGSPTETYLYPNKSSVPSSPHAKYTQTFDGSVLAGNLPCTNTFEIGKMGV